MDIGALLFWLLALALVVAAYRHKPEPLHRKGFALAGTQALRVLPRISLALLTAGFLGTLIPTSWIAPLIGADTGARGIALASVLGGFIPGGPTISFPIVVVLVKAGAGMPQLIALLTAWSVFAFHRIAIYEVVMMGWRFSVVRFISSLILPPIAGGLAGLVALLE